jgi:hypothetical protein
MPTPDVSWAEPLGARAENHRRETTKLMSVLIGSPALFVD